MRICFTGFAIAAVAFGCGDPAAPTPKVERTAAKLALTTSPSSSAPSRTAFKVQPVVQVRDAYDFAFSKSGVAVTAAVTDGGGSLGGNVVAMTNASGEAAFADLTIGGVVGTKILTFSAPGLTSVAVGVTVTAGAPSTLAINAGDGQTAYVGQPVKVAPSVRVADADGNPVQGASVQFAATVGGGSVIEPTAVSSATGIATVGSWMLGAAALGPNQLAVTSGSATVTFKATAMDPPTKCGQTAALTIGMIRDGSLLASQCVVTLSTRLGSGNFTGPQSGGTYFYDAFTLDVPANAIVRVRVSSNFSGPTILSYDATGKFLDRAFIDPLVVNNSSSAARRYQIVLTTFTAGDVGFYIIAAESLVSPP